MYPREFAGSQPDFPAVIMAGSGETITYGALERRANQGAHVLRELRLKAGDVIAVLLENSPRIFELYWAAQRAGLYYTPISTRLTATEAAYIVSDSGAILLVTSEGAGGAAPELISGRATLIPNVREVYHVGGALDG
ncbi:MAG: AMP-binding protein, partial [Alphaproteobacteria bacterium]|nr:AMP-binding protein [Alphaproteobacteria bacterium]